MLKYEIKDERKQKLPFNKTQALPQKCGVWFMQSNSLTNFMDIHLLEICAYNVHNIFVGSYFQHIMYFLSLLYKIKEKYILFNYFKYI